MTIPTDVYVELADGSRRPCSVSFVENRVDSEGNPNALYEARVALDDGEQVVSAGAALLPGGTALRLRVDRPQDGALPDDGDVTV